MRRLYLQIYASFLGIVVLFGVMAAGAWWLVRDDAGRRDWAGAAAATAAELLPPASEAAPIRESLERLAARFDAALTLRDADGRLLASAGEALPMPPADGLESGWARLPGHGGALMLALPDGRWLIVDAGDRHGGSGFLIPLGLLALAIAVGAYPLVRRLTGRIERLSAHVDALGGGDLAVRVPVEGRDEVAALAERFNGAAERIEKLVTAQKDSLAFASHELRTPLTRIRMAIDLLADGSSSPLHAKIARDIAELDGLIEELLLASRLDSPAEHLRRERIDLLGLAAEEARRYRAAVSGEAAVIEGDPRLLRRLLGNLLQNAARHGGRSPIEVDIAAGAGGGAVIRVMDRGPGVPAAERERIFEPFYRRSDASESGDRGVGLGLALVRRIAERHDGGARCMERAEGGTIFEVTLAGCQPAAPDPPQS